MTRITPIEVTLACDGACRFCAQVGLERVDRDADAVLAEVRRVGEAGEAIAFVGGEPTGRDELVAWIAAAREAGAPAVGVQTHARALGDPARAKALIDAGLTDVHVSIHGARAEVHDYHTDAPGSLDATIAGVQSLRQHGPDLRIVATTVVTRSSFRVLSELPVRLVGWGITAWSLAWIEPNGAAAQAFDRLVPRLGLAAPFVLHAIATARRLALPAFTSGLPLCVLGPFVDSAIEREAADDRFAEPCTECPARPRCSGIAPAYLARYGDEELRPVTAIERSSDERHAMFVGTGQRGPAPAEPPAESPVRARSRLPVLGRPDPAHQEVRRKQAADGEALRGLFPDLFSGDE